MFGFDIKLILAILASILTVGVYVPYLRDVFTHKTKPHLYSWLVWAITMGTATVALLQGGGEKGSWGLILGTLLASLVAILSLKYGTSNITRGDTYALGFSLLAILIWWKLDNPYLAVAMVSLIDAAGYIPTYRKSWEEPYSETISFWGISSLGPILVILSNTEYNFLTITYLATIGILNAGLTGLIFFRREQIKNV
jgi:hypothetical protein